MTLRTSRDEMLSTGLGRARSRQLTKMALSVVHCHVLGKQRVHTTNLVSPRALLAKEPNVDCIQLGMDRQVLFRTDARCALLSCLDLLAPSVRVCVIRKNTWVATKTRAYVDEIAYRKVRLVST